MISNESGPVNAVSPVLLNEDSTTMSPNVSHAHDGAEVKSGKGTSGLTQPVT